MTAEEHKKNVKETLQDVNCFVYIKEYVGDRFNGYHRAITGERPQVKAIRNCLTAMFDYIQFLEEKISERD